MDSSKDRIYVALIDGNVIGYVHANDYDVIYAPHMKNIMGIAVSSNFRKMGIGKALLDSVEHWARDTGASGVRMVSGATRKCKLLFLKTERRRVTRRLSVLEKRKMF